MRLVMDLSYTRIEFTQEEETWLKPIVEKALHEELGVKEEGYMFSPRYKQGNWDGIIEFYDPQTQKYPTGLTEEVEIILGNLQNKYTYQYTIFDDRPDAFLHVEDIPDELTLLDNNIGTISLRDYQYDAFMSIIASPSGVLHLSTNSGKTEIAASLIKELVPKLEKGETIAFFTVSTAIFNQTALRLEERLGIPIGKYGSGKKDIKQVNVVMIPTLSASLKADPEKGMKLTGKERIIKKMAKDIAPRFLKGVNQRQMVKAFLLNFESKNKADEALLIEIEKVLEKSESDAKFIFHMNSYVVKYNKLVESKNQKVYKKNKDAKDFIDSIVGFISDEHQHVTSDSLYNTLLACENAIYRVGLTGSIDKKNKMLLRRLKAVTGNITANTSNEFLITEGHSAKPRIIFSPIHKTILEGKEVDISNERQYMSVYEKGIAKNEYRNLMIARITEMWYNKGKGVLVIVSRIEHGEAVSELLSSYGVHHEFLKGEVEIDVREEKLDAMRAGELKVMIATSIIDEGVDISGIDVLIMGAGGKSVRQTLQRVGRALRKKKTGDNTTMIFDFYDRTNKFLLRHAKARKTIYEEENFDIDFLE